MLGNQIKVSFKQKNYVSTSRPLELLHLDLFSTTQHTSLGDSKYAFVILDDYSSYTWVLFLTHKNEDFKNFVKLFSKIQNLLNLRIIRLRTDNRAKFKFGDFFEFSDHNGISHEFLVVRVPEQNGVVKRQNRILQEAARTMISECDLPKYFWGEAVNTAFHVMNRVLLRPIFNKTYYELFFCKNPIVSYFKIFGCKCFILKIKENLKNFDKKSDEGIFLGYSSDKKIYRVYNRRTVLIEEVVHVTFDEANDIISKNV
ncbi:hypothetical protein ACH5RR_013321 [Cinchona calisaya]|uniref:Integrase catalytic domain-containing protein n=1 Tax=Cinchona calisaya TaxID=153742 RepID=A0ABD2ZZS8_9GENT